MPRDADFSAMNQPRRASPRPWRSREYQEHGCTSKELSLRLAIQDFFNFYKFPKKFHKPKDKNQVAIKKKADYSAFKYVIIQQFLLFSSHLC